ncbi:hypothetical protein MTBPR1_80074 [Candidatus Terasakiella magnetica]|uniref:Uncharacterized protein n=1 Tax=Candidatus Terasakiella magnetica TaxID=1867952 RepID=A0A1C3RL24_9PROT|nr:hypothetical protein [Candidatus Terasakiella magnetica]SCA58020.1 hypothetical protein MTBPR1_80074 [Candidatus Terasakiella magnetica]
MGRTVLVSAVVGMGVLIILGMIALVYGLMQKADNPDFKFFDLATEAPELEKALKDIEVPLVGKKSEAETVAPTAAPVSVVAPVRAFGDMRIEIPTGYKVVETDIDSQRLVLRLINEVGINRLMVLDINTGAKLGGLSLHPAQ